MAKNDGSLSQSLFEEQIQNLPKAHAWRMRDKKDMMALNKGRRVGTFANPADYLVGHDGILEWMEVKSCSGSSFPYSQIEPAQRSAACICAAIGTPYRFVIHSLKLDRWFQLTGEQFAADIKAGRKSRTFEELEICGLM